MLKLESRGTEWQQFHWWVYKYMELGELIYEFVILSHLPSSFLLTASSQAPSPRCRLARKRPRGPPLSTLPTWGRHSRLWMNCGGTCALLLCPFKRKLRGELHQGARIEVRTNSDSSLTHSPSLGCLSQTVTETEWFCQKSRSFVLFNTYHFSD